jgi:BMFP domain-containing protein YqiC
MAMFLLMIEAMTSAGNSGQRRQHLPCQTIIYMISATCGDVTEGPLSRRTKGMHHMGAAHCGGAWQQAADVRDCFGYTFMQEVSRVDSKLLDDLNRRVKELVDASPAKDIEKNLRAMMNSTFARLDLVTREEFDIQQEVLRRTREKLQALEARLAELEKNASGRPQ